MNKTVDIALIGAGIMSATLGVLLKELMPNASIAIYERLDKVGAESSDAWNNAGTGHSAFCELNYTSEDENGQIDIGKAKKIAESFEVSKQLWAHLVKSGHLITETPFINHIDHLSFVWGDDNIRFLKNRYAAMQRCPLFADMEFSESFEEIAQWVPLMMVGRDKHEHIAATRMKLGTDVNFGTITRGMISHLQTCDNVEVHLGQQVNNLRQNQDNSWLIDLEDMHTQEEHSAIAKFVFIGAGGGAFKLLEMSEIPEAHGYGGFPVSGQFLKCTNPDIVKQHEAKVYGKAAQGSPPMSVPHLDTRVMENGRALLFGPYAGFSTKFLKNGSYFDLLLSIEAHNVWPMLSAGRRNIPLTKYLIEQVMQSDEDRFEALQAYYPNARFQDWTLIEAGQRVQIIKRNKEGGGVLQFGTEIVSSADKTVAALLGASPGASTAVSIMLDLLNTCFAEQMQSADWKSKLTQMLPSYGRELALDEKLCQAIRKETSEVLGLAV